MEKDTLVKVFNKLYYFKHYSEKKIRHFKKFDGDYIVVYGNRNDSQTDNRKEELWDSWEIMKEKN